MCVRNMQAGYFWHVLTTKIRLGALFCNLVRFTQRICPAQENHPSNLAAARDLYYHCRLQQAFACQRMLSRLLYLEDVPYCLDIISFLVLLSPWNSCPGPPMHQKHDLTAPPVQKQRRISKHSLFLLYMQTAFHVWRCCRQ